MTGRSWRHFSVFWPFILAGAVGPPESDDAAAEPGDHGVAPTGAAPTSTSFGSAMDDGSLWNDGWVSSGGDILAVEEEPLGELPAADLASTARYKAAFQEKPIHDAVLEMFCKTAQLGGQLFGDNVADATSLTEAAVRRMEDNAMTLGGKYLQKLYGRINTSKVHRLVYHLGDELRERGNLWEGDTSQNEKLHGVCKRMYTRTNKRGPGVTLQMMRCEQTQTEVLRELDEAGDVAAEPLSLVPQRVPAAAQTTYLSFSGRGKRVAVGELSSMAGLHSLAEHFTAERIRWVTVHRTARIIARFEWGAEPQLQYVRAAANFIGKPWFSFVRYEGTRGDVRWGRARLVLRSLEGERRSCVVVQRLHPVPPLPGCVLTTYGCVRLGWDFSSVADEYPAVEIVDASRILRLEDVQVDWRDLSDRLGLRAMPADMDRTPIERRAARFFTNPFYPWTSRSLLPSL